MSLYIPKFVNDVNGFTHAWNKLLSWCRRQELQSSTDILVTQTSHGTSLTLAKQPSAKQSASTTTPTTQWFRGTWSASPPSPYMFGDGVQYGSGVQSGTYISTTNGNTTLPTSGIGWVQLSAVGNTYI